MKKGIIPVPSEREPVVVQIPKTWLTTFGKIAAKVKLSRSEFVVQLLASLGDLLPGQEGGETAPLSKEETEGGFRTIEIAIPIPIADLVPIETAAALRGVDPSILIGEALARGIAAHPDFLKKNPDPDETKH